MSLRKATFDDLLSLVRRLLGEGGCAWDRAQTPESLLPYLIEEAYEVREAVLEADERALAEELGDLALHIAFHSCLAEERGAFDSGEVFGAVVDKMVRRHPQVFPTAAEANEAEAPSPGPPPPLPWEELKRRQRGGSGGPGRTLEGVPASLPALLKAQRLQERAAGVGFDWPEAGGALEKAREELEEVARCLAAARVGGGARSPAPALPAAPRDVLEEEIGDLLFAVVNVTRRAGISAETALERASAKFRRRFESLEDLAAERGLDIASAGLEQLDALWDEVKRDEDRETLG